MDTDFQPVFIIGDHRSGTTVLYQALAGTGAFNVVTACDVIRNRGGAELSAEDRERVRLQLASDFAAAGLSDRGIDGVRVTPDLPEEYGFLIDDAPRPDVRPRTLPALVELGRRIRRAGGDHPVLLKNPWDVFTFAFIAAALPAARFVFVHRHPMHVMSSQLSATRALLASKNEYVAMLSPWYRRLFDRPLQLWIARALSGRPGPGVVGRHVVRAARYYLRHLPSLAPGRYTEVRYEDLCASPEKTIGGILEFLCLTAPAGHAASLVRPRGAQVSAEIQAQFRRIQPSLARYCARHQYSLEVSQ